MIEIWKDIEGYEGLYQISNTGKVKTIARICVHSTKYNSKRIVYEKELKQNIRSRSHQYLYVGLSKDSISIKYEIHRLVTIHFIEPPPFPGAQANHKDGNKLNNNDWNMEWITAGGNTQHSFITGLRKMKISKEQVDEMRRLKSTGVSTRTLAEQFRISIPYTYAIVTNKIRINNY